MSTSSTTTDQDVFSLYLNLDACDPCDDQTTEDRNPKPLPPLDFSVLEPWHDMPITLPPLDSEGSQETCWNIAPFLGPFSPTPVNDFTLLSPIVPSLRCSPSVNWLIDDEESVTLDDMNIPLIQRGIPSPCPPVPHPVVGSCVQSTGAEKFERPAPSSSPSSSSVYLSGTDSEYSNLFSAGTSALTSPATSVASLGDGRRSCSVSPVSDSRLSSPNMRPRKAAKKVGENDTAVITQGSRKYLLKPRKKQRRLNPTSSKRQLRQVSSGDPQDQGLFLPDQMPYLVEIDEKGNSRPVCLCGESFTRQSDMRRHSTDSKSCPLRKKLLERQALVDLRFVCDTCGGNFSRSDSLERHQKNQAACERVQALASKKRKTREYDGDDDD